MSNRKIFEEKIIEMSEANTFDEAKKEWELDHIEYHRAWNKCICDHDIKELCFIRNILNNNKTIVGNVCIYTFMDMDVRSIFSSLKKIISEIASRPNDALIEYAYNKKWIYENEEEFLSSMKHKKKYSYKQSLWIMKINERILKKIYK